MRTRPPAGASEEGVPREATPGDGVPSKGAPWEGAPGERAPKASVSTPATCHGARRRPCHGGSGWILLAVAQVGQHGPLVGREGRRQDVPGARDRKSTRLNSSHVKIS